VWSAFETAWKAAAQTALAKCDAMNAHMNMDHGDMGVLGKLSMMETHMVDHLEVVRAQKAALEPLFKALTDDQKKIANETLSGVMKVGMQMGGGGGMSGGAHHRH
jgi:Spy/CpxP family protein refolding chaperone